MKMNIATEILTMKQKDENQQKQNLVRIDADKEEFDFFKTVSDRFRHIKHSFNQLTKKRLIDKISIMLLRL